MIIVLQIYEFRMNSTKKMKVREIVSVVTLKYNVKVSKIDVVCIILCNFALINYALSAMRGYQCFDF